MIFYKLHFWKDNNKISQKFIIFFQRKKGKGFTLLEVLVGISVITILSLVLVINFIKQREQFVLQRVSHRLIEDLRDIQQMTLSAMGETCFGEKKTYDFGVYFDKTKSASYILFANCDSRYDFDFYADKILKRVNLEKKVRICSLNPGPFLSIVFTPPSPKVYINGAESFSEAQIILWWEKENLNCLKSNKVQKKIIKVNRAGLIELRN